MSALFELAHRNIDRTYSLMFPALLEKEEREREGWGKKAEKKTTTMMDGSKFPGE